MFQPGKLISQFSNNHPEVLYSVSTQEHVVALTIDDGPDPTTTPLILNTLAEHDVHATFFLLSDQIHGNEALVNRIINEGHEIANHLASDKPTILLRESEFEQALLESHEMLSAFDHIRWFRPGSGWFTQDILESAKKYGYKTVLGTVYPFDSQVPSSWFSTNYILWQVEPGSIIILHDRGPRGIRTIETLETVLPELSSRGFDVVSLSELVAYEE